MHITGFLFPLDPSLCVMYIRHMTHNNPTTVRKTRYRQVKAADLKVGDTLATVFGYRAIITKIDRAGLGIAVTAREDDSDVEHSETFFSPESLTTILDGFEIIGEGGRIIGEGDRVTREIR